MNLIKSFTEFLIESYLTESKEDKNRETFEPLAEPDKDDKSKEAEEKREKLKKYEAYYDKINSEYPEGSGKYDYWEKKLTDSDKKEYEKLLMEVKPIRVTRKPGGVMSIQVFDLGDSGADSSIFARRYREAIKDDVEKNGKPKGVVLDMRRNVGGQAESANALIDFFTPNKAGEEITVQRERDHMLPKDWTYEDYKERGSFSITKEQFEEGKKKGYIENISKIKGVVDPKDKLLDIPVVTLTSQRTFSGGEFITDTVKNLNPNAIHIGHNSGGGANKIGSSWLPSNKDKKSVEIAKALSSRIAEGYVDEKKSAEYKKAIDKLIEDGKIDDKMSKEDLVGLLQKEGNRILNDAHFSVHYDDGEIDASIPYMKGDRIVTDTKTKKPKDPQEFNGNWELSGTGGAGTAPFIETDPNTGIRDAMAHIYKQTGQKDLLDKLKKNPEELGLTKDGYDDGFNRDNPAHQHWLARDKETGEAHWLEAIQDSVKNAEQNKKQGDIEDIADKAIKDFQDDEGKKEIKNPEDAGSKSLFIGMDPKIAQKLRDEIINIPMPNRKVKNIQRETLMDFVQIDKSDPDEIALAKAQMVQYAYINELRAKYKLEPLIDVGLWQDRKLFLYKDNKEFKTRLKNKREKALKAMKKAKAKQMKHVKTFESYIGINEATQWFQGETIDDYINDGSSDWEKFWKSAKKGDTFHSMPDGVEMVSCKKSDLSKSSITVKLVMVGHDYAAQEDGGALCTIIDRKSVNLIGDDYDESEKYDTIFYTMEGDGDFTEVYLIPEM